MTYEQSQKVCAIIIYSCLAIVVGLPAIYFLAIALYYFFLVVAIVGGVMLALWLLFFAFELLFCD